MRQVTKEIQLTAIEIVSYMIDNEYIKEFECEQNWDYHIQDIIEDEITKLITKINLQY